MASSMDCFALCFCCFSICGHSDDVCCRWLPGACCRSRRDRELDDIERELQLQGQAEAYLFKTDSREHLPPPTVTQEQPGHVTSMSMSLSEKKSNSSPDEGVHRKSRSRGGLGDVGDKKSSELGLGTGSDSEQPQTEGQGQGQGHDPSPAEGAQTAPGEERELQGIPMALRPGGVNIRDKAMIMSE